MRFFRRLWTLIRRRHLDDELAQEFETHLAFIEEEEQRSGLAPDEARRAARLRFGGPRAHREQALDSVRAGWVEHAVADLRHAVRMLGRNPGFTLTAVLSLALGIGVNTAMFSVIEAVLLRPLPYERPSQLVVLQQRGGDGPDVTYAEYEVVRDQSRVFASVAAYGLSRQLRLDGASGEDWIQTLAVTAGFLETLGTPLALGRAFDSADTGAHGPPVLVLSDGTWRGTFGADPNIIGRVVRLDGSPSIVVGVLSPQFWMPQPVDALVPLRPTGGPADLGANTAVVARLRPAASLAQAQVAVTSWTDRLRRAAGRPSSFDGLAVRPMHAAFVRDDVRTNLLLLFGATGLLLLLACVNLAMLLMTRFAARAREIALRVALGSGLRRLSTQFLVENLTLVALGAAASLAAAYATMAGLVAWIPFRLPAATPIDIDRGVLLFALGMAVAIALLLTLVPLAMTRRLDVQHALRPTSRTTGQDDVRGRARNVLIVTEVALSTTLLVGAGLLVHSLYKLGQERLGFDPHGLTTFVTPLDGHPAGPDRVSFIATVTERLQALPGVRDVAAANVLPLAAWSNLPTERAAHPEQSIGGMEIRAVTPGYFKMLGIGLVTGRTFTPADVGGSAPVAMINETLARRWWPGETAIGDHVVIGLFRGRRVYNDTPREIVGVVTDAKDRRLTDAPAPTVFAPLEQAVEVDSSVSWMIKADRSPNLASLRAAVAGVDPDQRVLQVRTMDDIVAATTATSRFDALLFVLLAAVGVVLAAVGLYGVLSFVVARRRQEIGIRVALGAGRGQLFGMFLRQGAVLTAVGLVVGIGGSLLLSRWLSVLLYEVKADDPASFVAVAALFLVIGGAASALPASRAATVDPVKILRAE